MWYNTFKGLPSFSHRKLYNIYTYNQESFISLRVSAPADLFSPPPPSPLFYSNVVLLPGCSSLSYAVLYRLILNRMYAPIAPSSYRTVQNNRKKKNSTFDSVFCLLECLDFGIFENFEKFLHKFVAIWLFLLIIN